MFTDVSGFTNLTESLSKLGNEGPELTAFVINRYMELLVKAISQSGGDILKFAGDAMIVVWPPSYKTDIVQVHEDLRLTCRMALQNALDIQNKLNDTCILPDLKLSVKIGFGIGDINIIYVGGVYNRSEYLATGEPLLQAFQSEHCATKGGETIISKEVYEFVKDYFTFETINHDNKQFYLVKKLNAYSKVKLKAEATLIKNSIILNPKILQQLAMFVPAALKPYMEIGLERWGSELRRVTTMFINLSIDLSDAKTDSGLQRIQNVIRTVQYCVYTFEGSLNKLLMDDKGSTCIAVFGLPPVSHQNDPVRAIQSAFLLESELKKIKCKVAIGISTGIAYCGVVGTSGSRREYSVLGDCVNLAARLMQIATQPFSPCILIDQQSASDAQTKIQSIFWSERKVKGKEKGVLIYEPLCLQEDFKKIKDINTHLEFRVMNTQSMGSVTNLNTIVSSKSLQCHNNLSSTIVFDKYHINCREYDEELQPVGRKQEINQIKDFIQKFLDEFKKNKYVQNRLVLIQGEYGIGKSFLAKTVLKNIESLQNKEALLEIMISSLNPSSRSKLLNSIRIFLRNIFLSYAQRLNKAANVELIQQIYECDSHLANLISQVLSLTVNDIKANTIREDLTLAKSIKKFVYKLISLYLEQEQLQAQIQNEDQIQEYYSQALIILIDDMQDSDDGSLYLLKSILKNFKNILVVGCIRNQFKEFSFFDNNNHKSECQSEFLSKMIAKQTNKLTINLKGLKQDDQLSELFEKHFKIKSFICMEEDQKNQEQTMFARRKRTSSIDDIYEMVEILKKIRDPLMFWESKPELEEMDFNSLCINYLYVRTCGHPLKMIYLMKHLLDNHYIILDEQRNLGMASKKFRQLIKHEEWLDVDAPLMTVQINGPYIDKLTAVQQLILKQACVIGDIFDIQTLNYVNPFKDFIRQKPLINELNALYELGILDIMNMEIENIYYRFSYSFFRETIYQRMTYAQRRQAHKNVALALQKIPQPFDYHNNKEYTRMQYHWTQAQNRNSVIIDEGTLLPRLTLFEKKQLIIKKIKQILDQNRRNVLLKSGYINKRSEKGLQWNWRFCVISSEYLIVSQEDDNPEHILTIYLKHIQLIEREFNSEYFALTITTSQWSRGKQVFENYRKVYFALETEDELNEWITYLEFAKAYAIYMDFVNNFGRIQFPLSSNEYDFQLESELQRDNRRIARLGLIDTNIGFEKIQVRHTKATTSRATMQRKHKPRKSSLFAEGYRGSTSSSQQNTSLCKQIIQLIQNSRKDKIYQNQN
ncbi:unnamed protein product (macronuclear) [Paramecium tetraurelia]|uniref:PH domain-containing protein n=1 Tax=Paramecium tetraurelia TaxID=5888 RepID=A0BYP8_PARTE|nr:uncharacterized protein GSPATT00033518001 [Paramecium tetraurelia]CAK63665.1 unnamed protein product [Paramecium tetraurelia]|eukprot:XP_001431063.1 hypothetical protein (macronuclear) [Paramecium tetraurelia strain d4-2]